MKSRSSQLIVALIAAGCYVLLPPYSFSADSGDVRTRAEQSFDQLKQHAGQQDSPIASSGMRHKVEDRNNYSADHYLIGNGQGDMAKGQIVCQRVSELSARTDLAKQIGKIHADHVALMQKLSSKHAASPATK